VISATIKERLKFLQPSKVGVFVFTLNFFIIIVMVFLLINFLFFLSSPRLEVGLDSQWLYNVYLGGSGGLYTLVYEEKVWIDSIEYCEKVFCYKIVTANPNLLREDYITGSNHLIKSRIVDADDTLYEISYNPPLLIRPASVSVGDVWTWNSVATVKVISKDIVREEELILNNIESKVTDKILLSGTGGIMEGYLILETRQGVIIKRSVYSPTLQQDVRYEIPASMTWGELLDTSLTVPSILDFLRIRIPLGLALWHMLILLVTLFSLKIVIKIR